MAYDAVTREMYCPKCKQTFEEGSRRFCPTDGARLISDDAQASVNPGGVFANLIPKIEGLHELGETQPETQRFAAAEHSHSPDEAAADTDDDDDIFFELDDVKPDYTSEIEFLKPIETVPIEMTPIDPKPAARKVNPYEIPAGHVELGDTDRMPAFSVDFNENEPESFVGRIVKGRYKVTEFLGGDETGLAYIADDKIVDDKKVLVRILLGDESDEIMGSILAEERVSLSHFSHPNIARLVDSGQFTNGTNFLISEYFDALSVGDILSIHGGFDPSRAARIIKQAANGLNEAHQEGILHRDIRPENLIINVSDDGVEQTKLVNFGASNGDSNARNMAYKAPEVLDGRIATIASDIFSLAVVAYEMLTGGLPFKGETEKELFRSQYSGPQVHPTDVRPELPHVVDEVLDKALAFNAADRFAKARDFGDAFHAALTEAPQRVRAAGESAATARMEPEVPVVAVIDDAETVKEPTITSTPAVDEPAWKNRSPEPPQVENSRTKIIALIGLAVILSLLVFGWYYVVNHPPQPSVPTQVDGTAAQNGTVLDKAPITPASDTEMPPQPRTITQPPNTNFYENTKQNLKGDLLLNFVGFSMYYPKDWKLNGPQEGSTPNARGKFLDISRSTPDGRMKEQMLISYYPSKGTFPADADKYPQMVKETNETLKKLLPGYQMVSEGEIKLNGDWRAYEVKFQGGGTSPTGEKLVVWGRRLFIPAARPGIRDGFEITMLATSLADEVRSVDDVGVRGELAAILYSFEPSQNF